MLPRRSRPARLRQRHPHRQPDRPRHDGRGCRGSFRCRAARDDVRAGYRDHVGARWPRRPRPRLFPPGAHAGADDAARRAAQEQNRARPGNRRAARVCRRADRRRRADGVGGEPWGQIARASADRAGADCRWPRVVGRRGVRTLPRRGRPGVHSSPGRITRARRRVHRPRGRSGVDGASGLYAQRRGDPRPRGCRTRCDRSAPQLA